MPEPLNVLLIMTDQHNLDALGCYGAPHCRTPNLDRLAASGCLFRNAYTVYPECTPARASVLTGQFPHRHGLSSNSDPEVNISATQHELDDGPHLLSRRLQSAGYQCGFTGKWHIGVAEAMRLGKAQALLPSDVGFVGQDFPGHGSGGWRYPQFKAYCAERGISPQIVQAKGTARGCGILEGPEEASIEHFLADHTIGLIDRFSAQPEPFFIWHNFWGPHTPCYPPRSWYEQYQDLDLPPWPHAGPHPEADHFASLAAGRVDGWPAWQAYLRYYYAFTAFIDHQIGRMLDHLEAKGLADRTLVIFTADHGEYQGHYGGLMDKGVGHHELIQRIPFIARLPGAPAGIERPEFVSLVDILPTACAAAGRPCPTDVDQHGSSLLPLVRNEACTWRSRVVVESIFGHVPMTQVSLREENWKYGFNAGGRDELYDLASDPHEVRNRIDDPDQTGRVRHLREELRDWMRETGWHPHGIRNFEHLRLRARAGLAATSACGG